MARVDLRAEMATGLQRFHDLLHRHELKPNIVGDGMDV